MKLSPIPTLVSFFKHYFYFYFFQVVDKACCYAKDALSVRDELGRLHTDKLAKLVKVSGNGPSSNDIGLSQR